MKPETVKQAAEVAAEFMYHWMYDLGAPAVDCIDAGVQIYAEITGEELDGEEFFGITIEELEDLESGDLERE